MNKKLKLFVCITLVTSIMLSLTVVSFATDEVEPTNNSMSTPTRIYDDTNNYGYISSTADIDWWVISFGNTEGFANFYLGSIPTSCNYNMHIYKSDGTLIASSTDQLYYNELFRIRVYKNTDYYIKIVTVSGTSTTDSYKLRCKVYALKPTRIFTVDENNGWYGDFAGINLINTKQQAQNIIPSLWSMGYTATEYCNNSANAAASVYSTSDIIVVSTHGAPGMLGYNNSILYGTSNQSSNDTYKSIYADAGDASELDLVIYAACSSGVTSTNGNLVDITLDKGAYACLGWKNSLYSSHLEIWFDALFDALAVGNTVAEAMEAADNVIASYTYGEEWLVFLQDTYPINPENSPLNKLILGGY